MVKFWYFLCITFLVRGIWAKSYYDNCPQTRPDMLNVHLICHTHDDLGWLKTLDQYYFGSKKNIAPMGVQFILDSVIKELLLDSNRRFSYVETAFFAMWFEKQSLETKENVIKLVNEGRLEMVNGGWAMHDEASVHYIDAIDQMSLGLRWLNFTLGPASRPLVAWQIDPFGHSMELGRLTARMGFDAIYLGRIDFQDRFLRKNQQRMQTVWVTDKRHREADRLFTGIFYEHYSPPPGFCFDIFCTDDPITDDPASDEYNVDAKIALFLKSVREQAQAFRTNHLLLTMGNDFNYNDAFVWFSNLDKLIKYVNARNTTEKVNVLYSTPACYTKSLSESNVQFPKMQDDFFPYASDPHAYWTGYFTSKPALKRLIRYGSSVLQSCKQLSALTQVPPPLALMSAMAVAQHHDAITGTAKATVTSDYAKKLYQGIKECDPIISNAFNKMDKSEKVHHFCHQMNETQCEFTTNNEMFEVHVYNGLARVISWHPVRLPVNIQSNLDAFEIKDKRNDRNVSSQLIPIPKSVLNIPGRESQANYELVFKAIDLPALGKLDFQVKRVRSAPIRKMQRSQVMDLDDFQGQKAPGTNFEVIKGDQGVVLRHLGKNVSPQFGFYEAHAGNNSDFEDRASGAYIFRPKGRNPIWFRPKANKVYRGPILTEVHVDFEGDFVSHVIRMYNGVDDEFENEAVIGPIPIDDRIGKEMIIRYDASTENEAKSSEKMNNLHNEKVSFYTDSNGRQLLRRIKDYRSTFPIQLTEPIASNYYPLTSRILVETDTKQLVVITDRGVGATSLIQGVADVMVHRRLLYDDAFGVDEPLDEVAFGQGLVIRSKHWVQLGAKGNHRNHRLKGQETVMPPIISFSEIDQSGWENEINHEIGAKKVAFISKNLPPNLNLMSLEPWDEHRLLLRLEHIFDLDEDSELSKPATVDLRDIFADIEHVQEMTLAGTLDIKELKRLKWNMEDNNIWNEDSADNEIDAENTKITLQPMDIRTFLITRSSS